MGMEIYSIRRKWKKHAEEEREGNRYIGMRGNLGVLEGACRQGGSRTRFRTVFLCCGVDTIPLQWLFPFQKRHEDGNRADGIGSSSHPCLALDRTQDSRSDLVQPKLSYLDETKVAWPLYIGVASRAFTTLSSGEFSNATMLSLHAFYGRRLSRPSKGWKTWAGRCSYLDSPILPPRHAGALAR
jgi:hypothetical protein